MNFDIEALSIVLNTNIPDAKSKSIKFTRKLLYDPLDKEKSTIILNDYPYFTYDVKYPESNLLKLSYKDRVNFFFNLDRFNELLTPYIDGKLDSSNKDGKYYDKRTENIDANINTMLLLLFPTKYPMINELSDSWNYVVSNSKNKKQTYGFLYNPFATQLYSYLDIGGKKYTTKSVVWLNDIMNHPVYNDFLREYRDFFVQAKENESNAQKGLTDKIKTLTGYIKKFKDTITEIAGESSDYSTKTALFLNTLTNMGRNDNNELLNNLSVLSRNFNNIDSWSTLLKNEKSNGEITKSLIPAKNILKMIINLDLKQDITKLTIAKSYFTRNYEKLRAVANDIPIRKFYNILRQMKGEYLQSSNYELQNLVNLEYKTDIENFHDLMESLFKYMRNDKKDGEILTLQEKHRKLINVGLNFINLSVSDNRKTPRREIHIMIDLIEGEVNDKNWSTINCSYLSEYLGNEFETIVRSLDINNLSTFNKTKTNDWRVDKNRMMYSMEKQGFKNNITLVSNNVTDAVNFNKPTTIESKSFGENNIFRYKNENKIEYPNIGRLNSDFISNIYNGPNHSKIDTAIDRLNESRLRQKRTGEDINQNNLLTFLSENNKDFLSAIKVDEKKIIAEIEKITKLKGDNSVLLSNLNYKFELQKDQLQPNTPEYWKMQYKITMYELYDIVFSSILDNLKNQRNNDNLASEIMGGKSTMKKKQYLNKTHKINR